MNEIKVSVIMPVYNAEDFLERALTDALAQTLNDIEIICVDDGSTDNSRGIIQKFVRNDPRVRLLEQENQYAGTARNNGLRHAKGLYVVFWDSDDMFYETALEKMYVQAEKTQADICVCAAERFDNDSQTYISTDVYLKKRYLPGMEVFNKFDLPEYIFNFATNVPWNKMFRKSFIEEHGLQFQTLRQANDTYFVLMALFLAERITYVEDILLAYRVNNNASLSGKASDTTFCSYDSYVYTMEKMGEHTEFALVKQSFLNRVLSGFYRSLNIQSTFDSYQKLYEKIVSEGLEYFELSEKDENYFYSKWMYEDMHNMMFMSPEEFLLQKNTSRRIAAEKEKNRHSRAVQKYENRIEKLSHKLEKKSKEIMKLSKKIDMSKQKIDSLTRKIDSLTQKIDNLEQSFSYRLGRGITLPVRKLRKMNR